MTKDQPETEWDNTEGAHPAWWRGCDYGYTKGKAAALDVERLAEALRLTAPPIYDENDEPRRNPRPTWDWMPGGRIEEWAFGGEQDYAAELAATYARLGEPEP